MQIVGLDVLDAVPVHRGYSRGDLVEDLLDIVTEMVDDIERLHMNTDYDATAVENAAEKQGVIYTNRKSRDADDKRRMREMWKNGEAVRIVEAEDRTGMPTRKKVYVPHIAVDDGDEEDNDKDDGIRQELLSDFADAGGKNTAMPRESPFEPLLAEMYENEEREKEDVDGAETYVVFETNDPLADKRGAAGRDAIPKSEQRHAAARRVRKYGRRWGIENGYKKLGHFLPRSGRKDPVLRFFGESGSRYVYCVIEFISMAHIAAGVCHVAVFYTRKLHGTTYKMVERIALFIGNDRLRSTTARSPSAPTPTRQSRMSGIQLSTGRRFKVVHPIVIL